MFNKTHPSLSTCSRILATSINSSVVCLVQNSGLYPTCNEKIFVLTSPSLPASSNQNLPFLLLSSLHGNTLLEHLSLSPSLVWKDIAQWWRYVLGISSFLLSNRESVGLESAKKISLHQERNFNDTQLMKDCLYQIGIKMHIWPTFIRLVRLLC